MMSITCYLSLGFVLVRDVPAPERNNGNWLNTGCQRLHIPYQYRINTVFILRHKTLLFNTCVNNGQQLFSMVLFQI